METAWKIKSLPPIRREGRVVRRIEGKRGGRGELGRRGRAAALPAAAAGISPLLAEAAGSTALPQLLALALLRPGLTEGHKSAFFFLPPIAPKKSISIQEKQQKNGKIPSTDQYGTKPQMLGPSNRRKTKKTRRFVIYPEKRQTSRHRRMPGALDFESFEINFSPEA